MGSKVLGVVLLLAFTLSSTYSYAQVRTELPKYYTASEWAVFYGHAIDTATTQHCLGAGTCHELNPYLGRFKNPIGFTTAKIGIGFAQLYIVRKVARYKSPKLASIFNVVVSSALTTVAIHNQRVGTK